jgi:hypothetical protein
MYDESYTIKELKSNISNSPYNLLLQLQMSTDEGIQLISNTP